MKFNMCSKVRTFVSVIVFVNLVTAAVLRNEDLFQLDLVHYNDFHSRFEETTINFPICTSNDTNCLGGFSRLYHEVKALLQEKPDAIVLDAGDTYQGTYWYTLMKWNVTQHFINMLPNDAHAVGNHEFDGGVEGLVPYLAGLQAPMLIANIDTSLEPSLNGLYKPHIVVQRKGKKIGIIGVTTKDTKMSSRPGNVIFLDPIKAVSREAKLLTDQGIDIIIVLSHCGLNVDKKIAKAAGENIDIIVGGHSHSLLWNGEPPSKEEVSGPYPVLVESGAKPGHKVLVVTASAFTKYLGNLTANFENGELVSFEGKPVFLNRSIPEDPETKALLQPYSDKLHQMVNEVIGYADDSLLDNPCSRGECAIGNIIADAFLNATNELKPSNLSSVAFLMRNMIRGALSKGEITRGAIINAMPFTNKLATFELQGKYLLEALEQCLQVSWREKPFTGPWMPQVSGMQVTVNTTSKTVESVLVRDGDTFVPLRNDQDYQVSTPDFLVITGNNFEMLMNNSQNLKTVGLDYKIIEDYVRKVSPLSNNLDKRLTVVT